MNQEQKKTVANLGNLLVAKSQFCAIWEENPADLPKDWVIAVIGGNVLETPIKVGITPSGMVIPN